MSLELERTLGIERYTQLQSEFIPGLRGAQGDTGSGFDGSGQVVIVYSGQTTLSGGTVATGLLNYVFAAGDLRPFIDTPLVFSSVIGNSTITPAVQWQSTLGGVTAIEFNAGSTQFIGLTKICSHVNNNNYIIGHSLFGNGMGGIDTTEDWASNGGTVILSVAQAVAAPSRLTAKMIVAIIKGVS